MFSYIFVQQSWMIQLTRVILNFVFGRIIDLDANFSEIKLRVNAAKKFNSLGMRQIIMSESRFNLGICLNHLHD